MERLLWQPSAQDIEQANLTQYMHWLAREKGLSFTHYGALWRWSVNNVAEFAP